MCAEEWDFRRRDGPDRTFILNGNELTSWPEWRFMASYPHPSLGNWTGDSDPIPFRPIKGFIFFYSLFSPLIINYWEIFWVKKRRRWPHKGAKAFTAASYPTIHTYIYHFASLINNKTMPENPIWRLEEEHRRSGGLQLCPRARGSLSWTCHLFIS